MESPQGDLDLDLETYLTGDLDADLDVDLEGVLETNLTGDLDGERDGERGDGDLDLTDFIDIADPGLELFLLEDELCLDLTSLIFLEAVEVELSAELERNLFPFASHFFNLLHKL